MYTQTPSGVVLDEPQARAILYVAVCEGLVDGDPNIGDGFVKMLLGKPPSQEMINNSFEQLVIGGRIYVPFQMPREWKGELFEKGLVVPIPYIPNTDDDDLPALPTQIVLGMLRARGIDWDENQLLEKYQNFAEAHRIWESNKGDKNYENFGWRKLFSRFIAMDFDYTQEEIDRWERVQRLYSELGKVVEVANAYNRILNSSFQQNALSSVPILPANQRSLSFHNLSGAEERQLMLKITCKELRRVPITTKLSKTIELAESSEAKALRNKMAEWTELLRQGNLDLYTQILNSVSKARKELSYSKTLSVAGDYSTWIGFAATTPVALIAPEVAAALGFVTSIVGGLFLAGNKVFQFRNRWAMFAQE